jgi:enoyl-CoA hydratase/carnithine racemase
LARQPAEALAVTKSLLKRPLGRSVREAMEEEYPHFIRLMSSDAAREIFTKFLSKR